MKEVIFANIICDSLEKMVCQGWRPFSLGLFLVNLVAVPTLITLILLYLTFGYFWHDSYKCDVCCCELLSKIKKSTPDPKKEPYWVNWDEYHQTHYWDRRSSELIYDMEDTLEEEVRNPAIAALVEDLYHDDETEKVFRCSVVLMSKNWALTTSDCVGGSLNIRIASNYWSKEGIMIPIKKFVTPKNPKWPSLVLLNFDTVDFIPYAKISSSQVKNVSTFIWRGMSWNQPLAKRQKFGTLLKLKTELLQKTDCQNFANLSNVLCYIITKRGPCGNKINAPLIDPFDNLVGIHLSTSCEENKNYSIISYIAVKPFMKWINQTILYY